MTQRTFITTAEACRILGVSRYTVRRWRMEGIGPTYYAMGGVYRYTREDIEAWAASRMVEGRFAPGLVRKGFVAEEE